MKYIKQFRFYGNNNEKNYPSNWSNYYGMLTKGNILSELGPVSQLGIQARPETTFYLNDSRYPIVIGRTGIFELDLEGRGIITSIKFDSDSLSVYNQKNNKDRLLIDVVYEGVGVNL